MVRIINLDNPDTPANIPEQRLEQRHFAILNLLGQLIANEPERIIRLLALNGILLASEAPDQQICTKLLEALGLRDDVFNRELAQLLVKHPLKSDYSEFNAPAIPGYLQQFEGKDADVPDFKAAIATLIDQLGTVVEQSALKLQAHYYMLKSAKDNRPDKHIVAVPDNRNRSLAICGLLLLLGIGTLAYIKHVRTQGSTNK